jgi:glycosyltransferase involved in cell wall biosynthesis
MRIGYTTYPVAFQRSGGLEVQIRESADALRGLGADVHIVELYSEKLDEFDIIHHFSLKHGSDRIVQYAHTLGIPVVATPLVDPATSPISLDAINLGRRILHKLAGHTFRSYWDELEASLSVCDHVFPLTGRERAVLERFYPPTKTKCTVIGNGVADRFFQADASRFRALYPLTRPMVLSPSSIERRKNQLQLIAATRRLGAAIVMAGPILDEGYWEACQAAAGDSLIYLGELPADSELLCSAFAAADCVALVSHIEPFGLVPFEALAAGTPALLTTQSGVDTQTAAPWFQRVNPSSPKAIDKALRTAIGAKRDRAACRALVSHMRWQGIATQLLDAYYSVCAAKPTRINGKR